MTISLGFTIWGISQRFIRTLWQSLCLSPLKIQLIASSASLCLTTLSLSSLSLATFLFLYPLETNTISSYYLVHRPICAANLNAFVYVPWTRFKLNNFRLIMQTSRFSQFAKDPWECNTTIQVRSVCIYKFFSIFSINFYFFW